MNMTLQSENEEFSIHDGMEVFMETIHMCAYYLGWRKIVRILVLCCSQ